jgi:hypothetical protein
MKVKSMHIRKNMHIGDVVSIPFEDGYKLGVVETVSNDFYHLKIIRKDIYYADEEIGFRTNENGNLIIGVVG